MADVRSDRKSGSFMAKHFRSQSAFINAVQDDILALIDEDAVRTQLGTSADRIRSLWRQSRWDAGQALVELLIDPDRNELQREVLRFMLSGAQFHFCLVDIDMSRRGLLSYPRAHAESICTGLCRLHCSASSDSSRTPPVRDASAGARCLNLQMDAFSVPSPSYPLATAPPRTFDLPKTDFLPTIDPMATLGATGMHPSNAGSRPQLARSGNGNGNGNRGRRLAGDSQSCVRCRHKNLRCNRLSPCEQCLVAGVTCDWSGAKAVGNPSIRGEELTASLDRIRSSLLYPPIQAVQPHQPRTVPAPLSLQITG